jgi:ATP-dependent RNA helicase RhlE
MLDLGFIHSLRRIATLLPRDRQTMLFSATMPKQMEEIAAAFLRDPVRVQVNPPGKAVDKIEQSVHFVAKAAKFDLLVELLDAHRDELSIVFGRTKHGMEKLSKQLEHKGFAVASIHGNKSQGQRDRAIAAFRAGEVRVLVATDVAARGLDIPEVRHVYNYELPNVPENYVHRIGRTARAGMDGAAIALCSPDEMGELKDIEKAMKAKIPVASGAPWEVVPDAKAKTSGRPGGRPGGRPSGQDGRGPGGQRRPVNAGGKPAGSQGQRRQGAARPRGKAQVA